MSWWTPQRQAHAFNYLLSAGLTPYGAAGLVSRWMYVEAAGGPASINPSSGAFGIAQWLTRSRLDPIRGNTNFDDQLAHVVWELNNDEWRAAQVLRSANSVDEGAVGATMYERAEGYPQLKPRDYHTPRTAAGIPKVLAAVGASSGTPIVVYPPTDAGGSDLLDAWRSPSSGPEVGVIVVGVVALLAVVWLLDL